MPGQNNSPPDKFFYLLLGIFGFFIAWLFSYLANDLFTLARILHLLLGLMLGLLFAYVFNKIRSKPWSGFENKTVADLLSIFLIPIIGGIFVALIETESDKRNSELVEKLGELNIQLEANNQIQERFKSVEDYYSQISDISSNMKDKDRSYATLITVSIIDRVGIDISSKNLNPSEKTSDIRSNSNSSSQFSPPISNEEDNEEEEIKHRRRIIRFLKDLGMITVDNSNNTPYIDLSLVSLQRADFVNLDLSGVDFGNSKIENANFQNTTLEGTNLRDAQLINNDFSYANLRNARVDLNFFLKNDKKTALVYVLLNPQNIERIPKLTRKDLTKEDLSISYLQKVDFKDYILDDANFQGSILDEANLEGASLKDANLNATRTFRTNIKGTVINEKTILPDKLQRLWNLLHIEEHPSEYKDSDYSGTLINDVVFEGVTFKDINFRRAKFENVRFSNVIFDGVNFDDSILENVKMENVKILNNSSFDNTEIIDKSIIKNTQFIKIKFKSTKFESAEIYDSMFSDVFFSNVRLENTDIRNSNFQNIDGVLIGNKGIIDCQNSKFFNTDITFKNNDLRGINSVPNCQ